MSYKDLSTEERRVVFVTWRSWQLYPVPKQWVDQAINEALITFRSQAKES